LELLLKPKIDFIHFYLTFKKQNTHFKNPIDEKQQQLHYIFPFLFIHGFSSFLPCILYTFRQQFMLRIPLLHSYVKEVHKHPAESMSPENVFRYLHWSNCAACQLLIDFGFIVMARLGNPGGVPIQTAENSCALTSLSRPFSTIATSTRSA
jgi:hypothetical protein